MPVTPAIPGIVLGLETSHALWLALLLPLLVLSQAGLLRVRNRVRDRIHGSPATETDLESVVRDALETVFEDAAADFDDSLDQPSFRAYLVDLVGEVADRTDARVELTGAERAVLRSTLTDAVLEAFDLTDSSA